MSPTIQHKPPETSEENSSGTRPTTRQETKRTGKYVADTGTREDIKTALDGRKYLELKQLVWPPGEPITTPVIIQCLHYVYTVHGQVRSGSEALFADPGPGPQGPVHLIRTWTWSTLGPGPEGPVQVRSRFGPSLL